MGFLKQLGKGFVRSAINQVGRDTGRVISNQIYGDLHAIPIRGVVRKGGQFYSIYSKKIIDNSALRNILHDQGFNPELSIGNIFVKLFLVLLSCCFFAFWYPILKIIAFIPIICFLSKGVIFLSQQYVEFSKMEDIPIYVSDRRYNTGRRLSGYTKRKVSINIDAKNNEKKKLRRNGIIYLITSVLIVLLSYPYAIKFEKFAFSERVNNENAKRIINNGLKSKLSNWESYKPISFSELDSLFISDSVFNGFKITHSFQANNKAGKANTYIYVFYLDKEVSKILKVENIKNNY
jgi:hypothetical protein